MTPSASASVSTPAPSPTSGTARERLLEAAAAVFAQQGLMAATTREIAYAARVNEVTLFRQFQNKQNLLAAVIERVFAAAPSAGAPRAQKPVAALSLRELVKAYADFYHARLRRNVRLIRVLIGEIQHCDEHAQKVVRGVFLPQRQEFVEQLQAAQKRGVVRKEAEPAILADQIGGMILTSVLKSDMPMTRCYPAEGYLEACVDLIVRAYAPASGPRKRPARGRRRTKA